MAYYAITMDHNPILTRPYFNSDMITTELSWAKTVAAAISALHPGSDLQVVTDTGEIVATYVRGYEES